MTSDPIRVLVADDIPLIGAGIEAALSAQPDIALVAHVVDPDQLHAHIARYDPHLVLLDLQMGDFRTADFIREVTGSRPGPYPRLLVVSAHRVPYLIKNALAFGLAGYLLKEDLWTERLPDLVRRAHAGEFVASRSIRADRHMLARQRRLELTPTEQEVLALFFEDKLDPGTIARRLGRDRDAVYSTLRRVRIKLGVSDNHALRDRLRALGALYLP